MKSVFVAKVRDLSQKGLGVLDHPDGRTFFVRGVWPGDLGEFEISDEARKYDEALLIKIINPSNDRIQVKCYHRGVNPGQCGGCPWMIADYSSQLKYKLKRLVHALEKRGLSFTVKDIQTIKASPQIYSYRNRVQLKTNGFQLGYVSEGTSVFAPIEHCLIMNEKLNTVFNQIKKTLPREDFKPSEDHRWCFLDLDDEQIKDNILINKRRPFRQGNTEQNEFMRKWVMEHFKILPRHIPVIDLFCGSGNFTEVLSELGFINILAVEVQGSALNILREKNLSGVRILEMDINQKGSWAQIAKYQPHAKAILIDPPREGLLKRKGLFKYLDNLEHIFYISCEIDTYSRDIRDMISRGWVTKEILPVDLFPHTPHIEVLSHLTTTYVN
jgi:23S rRNA (uracil1939-C5)-methyltransferase